MKASIIIPCYNAEKWIERCLSSALNQTHEDIEVIVVDNESTDGTLKILEEVQKENKELIIDKADNIYPNCWDEARGRGFEISTGDYLFTLASDDYLSPSYISNCLKYFSVAPDKIFAIQSAIKCVKGPEEIYVGNISHEYKSLKEFMALALLKCPANSPTVAYSRVLYDDGLLNTKPETYGGAADYDLYCKLANEGIFIYPVDQWLGYFYRWHEEQATWNVQKEEKNYDKMIQEYWSEKWTTQ